jgi:transcriptional regulator with XRE-family HTH domain
MQAPELIDRAQNITGSAAELARQLGVTFQEVSNWRHGRRTCPPDMRARMAALAGLDPIAAMVDGLADGLSDQRRAGFLEALKSCGKVTGFAHRSP